MSDNSYLYFIHLYFNHFIIPWFWLWTPCSQLCLKQHPIILALPEVLVTTFSLSHARLFPGLQSKTTIMCAKGQHFSILETGIKKAICHGLTIAFDCLDINLHILMPFLTFISIVLTGPSVWSSQWSEFCENTALAISVSFGIYMGIIKKPMLFTHCYLILMIRYQ